MQFRLVDAATAAVALTARTPFRFGSVTVAQAPLLHLRVRLESVAGRTATGMAADLLVPRWFRKDLPAGVDAADAAAVAVHDQAELRASAAAAVRAALATSAHRSVFALWHDTFAERVLSQPATAPDLLVRGFGAALLERAVIDAACRLARKGFWAALRGDLFGIRLGQLHGELRDVAAAQLLPDRPRERLFVRHTVGMLDVLRDRDAAPGSDGEPVSVEGYLRRDRLRWLKVKIGQGPAPDRARLLALAALCRDLDADVRFTLDGNEQFADLQELADLLASVDAEPLGRELLRRTAHVEQPLPRAATFDPAANGGIAGVARVAPLALDEADVRPDSFPQALALGWRGCSAKNCKGVFRALANLALARHRAGGAFVCAEDLTNVPLLSLQQDLLTALALDVEHVERNGHHYFRGLDHLPRAVVDAAINAHGDLYRRRDDGGALLAIDDGAVRCASLQGRGYACDDEAHAALLAALPWQPVD